MTDKDKYSIEKSNIMSTLHRTKGGAKQKLRIKTIIRKILAILIPAAITYFTYPIISDYYFTSCYNKASAPTAPLAGALIIVDCIAWLFGYFVFSGNEE